MQGCQANTTGPHWLPIPLPWLHAAHDLVYQLIFQFWIENYEYSAYAMHRKALELNKQMWHDSIYHTPNRSVFLQDKIRKTAIFNFFLKFHPCCFVSYKKSDSTIISYFYLHDAVKPVQLHNFLNFEIVFQYLKLRWKTGKVKSNCLLKPFE